MSAQVALDKQPAESTKPRLMLLPSASSKLSNMGFGILLALLVVAGMAAVMVVSTTVAVQSREIAGLETELERLTNVEAALETELQETSSSSALALRATELGMVPNPYPAFIQLADQTIVGEPTAVTNSEG